MDHSTFDDLYEAHRPKLISYALSLVSDHQLAEDLVQEAALRLWKAIEAGIVTVDEGESRTDRFFVLFKNNIFFEFLDHRRKSTLKIVSLEEVGEKGFEIAASAKSFVDQILTAKLVDHCLSTLTDEDRRIIYLLVEGYNSKEIGKELGISPPAVRKRIERARRKLRSLLIPGERDVREDEGGDS